jgi:hypothetical protein
MLRPMPLLKARSSQESFDRGSLAVVRVDQAAREASGEADVFPGTALWPWTRYASRSDVFVFQAESHHARSERATVSTRTRKEAQHVRIEVRA